MGQFIPTAASQWGPGLSPCHGNPTACHLSEPQWKLPRPSRPRAIKPPAQLAQALLPPLRLLPTPPYTVVKSFLLSLSLRPCSSALIGSPHPHFSI